MHSITRRLEFDAAHRIPEHGAKCRHLHGHRYAVEIVCTAPALDRNGFVVDYGVIKQRVGGWIDEHWDHNTLYYEHDRLMRSLEELCIATGMRRWYALPCVPSAENLAHYLHDKASELLGDAGVKVRKTIVYETPNCSAVWEHD